MKQSNLSGVTLILGFFDGIHIGHRRVIGDAVNYAEKNDSKTVLLTFLKSPAEYFNGKNEYIYNRNLNYEIIKSLGVDVIVEEDFAKLVNITAEDYLDKIIKEYSPSAIFTGFNYTFGAQRKGTPEFFKIYEKKFDYKYFRVEPVKKDGHIVSSTLIKELLHCGELKAAGDLLNQPFILKSKVISGEQMARKLGFPTANMLYPENIVKLPYGVYKIEVFNKIGVLNWGTKPTFDGEKPLLEAHILNFNENLYEQNLELKVLKRIRGEKKFASHEELELQIQKDIEECLK